MDIQELLSRLQKVKQSGDSWVASCPAHGDKKQSLSVAVKEGRILLHCFAGCTIDAVLQALNLELKDLFTESNAHTLAFNPPNRCNPATHKVSGCDTKKKELQTPLQPLCTTAPISSGCTLKEYLSKKALQACSLDALSVTEVLKHKATGKPALRIPYFDKEGATVAVQSRISMTGDKFRWRTGDKPLLYGLWKLTGKEESLILCEGASDYHTLFEHGIPALALPGAASWREDRDARHFEAVNRIYTVIEPDAGGEAVKKWISGSRIKGKAYLVSLHPFKDPSSLHIDDPDKFKERFQRALDAAERFIDVEAKEKEQLTSKAWTACQSLATRESILEAFERLLPALSVAGEESLCKLIFLAMTSRLFERPVSIGVKGPSAGGKSFAVAQVCKLFPESAYHSLSSMSEHALAYSNESFKNRMLVIYEAVGMESDHISYIIRTLLSEGRIRHETVVKTERGMEPLILDKEGPTGLIVTTTALNLHAENETRMLSICVNDSRAQTKAILKALANEEPEAVDLAPWIALQSWLESGERLVSIPFAGKLADLIPPIAVRLRRDFTSVLSLIRAHALLHRASRDRDLKGRILATLEDYATVRGLVSDYIAEALESAVSATVRETVEAVQALKDLETSPITVRKIAEYLKLDKSATSRRVKAALSSGYLVNKADEEQTDTRRKVRKYKLAVGEPMPTEQAILPDPELLIEEEQTQDTEDAPAPIETRAFETEESVEIPAEGIPF